MSGLLECPRCKGHDYLIDKLGNRHCKTGRCDWTVFTSVKVEVKPPEPKRKHCCKRECCCRDFPICITNGKVL